MGYLRNDTQKLDYINEDEVPAICYIHYSQHEINRRLLNAWKPLSLGR